MPQSIREQYLEAEVLNAHPVKLTVLLYRAAVESIASARRHLRQGEIYERSRAINKALDIITELLQSLNHAAGGEISRNLAALYAYVQTRLIEANTLQAEPPLAEVERLLATLLEGWTAAVPAAPAEAEYAPVDCTY